MATPDFAECLNCGAALTGPFCANCGQRRAHTDLTLRELVADATAELAHWDGKVPQTLKVLFFQPGVLTRDFLAGRRARWLRPLRLYLICSLAFFLVKPVVEGVTQRPMRDMAQLTVTDVNTPKGRRELEEGLPARIFGADRLIRAAADGPKLNRAISSAFPKAMFVLLPVFAVLTRIAWRRAMPRYPAHLYFGLHLHAAVFGAFAVALLSTAFVPSGVANLIGVAGLAYAIWYALVAMRRVFGESWVRTTAKGAAVGVAYLVCFLPVSLAMLAYAIFRM